MNEVIKVSIAGINLALNQDTYELLNGYLQKLETKYIGNPDGAEILADIESRIIELILETQEQSRVVSASTIEDIIKRLGYPDSEDTDPAPKGTPPPQPDQNNRSNSVNSKIYRPLRGGKIAGVCAAFSNRYNINVTWIRLLLSLSLILAPYSLIYDYLIYTHQISLQLSISTIILYITLWIAIPKAKSHEVESQMNEGNSDPNSGAQDIFDTPENGRKHYKKLYRSSVGGVIAGVCSGLSTHFRIDVVWIRLVFMLLLVVPFPLLFIVNNANSITLTTTFGSIIFYVILWFSMPKLKAHQQSQYSDQNTQPPHSEAGDAQTYSNPTSTIKVFPKRLYRSAKGGVVGGVCSGLSNYFNIHVAWIRLAYLAILAPLMFISFMMMTHNSSKGGVFVSLLLIGCVILLYAVLWIVVPMAKSARHKLEMNGESVTAHSIGRQISSDANEIDSQSKESGLASIFAEMLKFVGKVIMKLLKVIFIAATLAISLPLMVFIVVIVTLIIMSLWGILTFTLPFTLLILPQFIISSPHTFISALGSNLDMWFFFTTLIIPLSATFVALITLIGGWKRAIAWSLSIMIIIWIAMGSYMTYTIASDIDDRSIEKNITRYWDSNNRGVTQPCANKWLKANLGHEGYYIKYTKTKDSTIYERGVISMRSEAGSLYRGDTTVNAKITTKYNDTEYEHSVEIDKMDNTVIELTKTSHQSGNYTLCKILFTLSILATLWFLVVYLRGKKRYFILSMTIMIALWLISCTCLIKYLYFTSEVNISHSKLTTTKSMVGDSIKIDTIANYTHIVDIN